MRGEPRLPRATATLTVGLVALLALVGGMGATADVAAPVRDAVGGAARVLVPAGLDATRHRGAAASEATDPDVDPDVDPDADLGATDVASTVATLPLAEVGPLVVHVPSVDPVVVGFHEASTTASLPMSPLGVLLGNENSTRFDAPPTPRDPEAQAYLVLSSRGRAAGPTTAVDVVLRDDEPVLAPVSGIVSDVRGTWLYGQYADIRLELRPDDAPDTRVVVVHIEEPAVAVGDRVTVGETVLAPGPRRFPFASQIDRETEPERWPHVHLEVSPGGCADPATHLTGDAHGRWPAPVPTATVGRAAGRGPVRREGAGA